MRTMQIIILALIFSVLTGCQTASKNSESWPSETREAVESGTLLYGMTKDQVRASWGYPRRTNKRSSIHGTSDCWVYQMTRRRSCFVYFRDGKLVSVR